jgi:hypothetical protein
MLEAGDSIPQAQVITAVQVPVSSDNSSKGSKKKNKVVVVDSNNSSNAHQQHQLSLSNTLCKDWLIGVNTSTAMEHAKHLGMLLTGSEGDGSSSGNSSFPWVAAFQSVRMGINSL